MFAPRLQPTSDTRPIALCTQSHGVVLSANPPKPIKPQKVSFILPSNHLDKHSKAYRQLTPARLQLAQEQTPWKQSPIATNWRERSCAKVWADTLHNNQFAPLADDEDNDDKDSALALPVLDHATGKTLKHRQLRKHPDYKKLGIDPTPTNLADCAKALVSNPPTQTKKPAPVQLHHPLVAPPPLLLVLPQNNNVLPEPTPCIQSCSTKFHPIKHRM
jgi:hypothetical protein